MESTNVNSNNLSAYAPADHLAKRARVLQGLAEEWRQLRPDEQEAFMAWMRILFAKQQEGQ